MADTHARCNSIATCEKLGGIPCAAVVGSYGGGDSMRMGSVLLATPIASRSTSNDDSSGTNQCALIRVVKSQQPSSGSSEQHLHLVIGHAFGQQVMVLIGQLHNNWLAMPACDRVAQLPESLHHMTSIDQLALDTALVICSIDSDMTSSAANPAMHLNVFAQGWLFDEELQHDQERQGIKRDALIGMWSADGLQATADPTCAIGSDTLNIADQHAHRVVEHLELDGFVIPLEDWHLGSDMAQVVSALPPRMRHSSQVLSADGSVMCTVM
jgi:hypothetical protein